MTISLTYVAALCAIRLAIFLIVEVYYSDSDRMLAILKLQHSDSVSHRSYHKRWDAILTPFPFLWTWLDILIAVSVAQYINNCLAWGIVSIVAGGRFRALQEFGHNAIHFALCQSHKWQYSISEVFCEAPLFRPEMHIRKRRHSGQHHPNPNQPGRDPNFAKVIAGGMVPGISRLQFVVNLFNPLRLSTLRTNVSSMIVNACTVSSLRASIVRWVAISTTAIVLYLHAGLNAIIWGWLFPLTTSYQLFAWWALLAEHRWHFESDAPSRIERELANARPTDYVGLSGYLVRFFIAPTSDAYHLVHSLYPHVRWNYLPAIDDWFKVNDPRYTEHASLGFFFSRNGIPSALSELYDRLTSTTSEPVGPAEVGPQLRAKESTHA